MPEDTTVKVKGIEESIQKMNAFGASLDKNWGKIKSYEGNSKRLLKGFNSTMRMSGGSGVVGAVGSAASRSGFAASVGSFAGAVGGGKAGAILGGKIGSILGPKGTLAGAFIGGTIGAVVGSVAGEGGASLFSKDPGQSPYTRGNNFFQGINEDSFYSPKGQEFSEAQKNNEISRLDFLAASLNDINDRIFNYVRQ